MILETFAVGPLQCNCTLLGDEEAGEAIVIDPGDEISRIHGRLLKLVEMQAGWLGIAPPEVETPDASLADGMTVGLERFPAEVLHTPGHTPGSVCLHFAPLKMVIAGDTLFAGSIGRTDLPGGNGKQIIESIETRLMALPDETAVIAGHGATTTISAERNLNPFLRRR